MNINKWVTVCFCGDADKKTTTSYFCVYFSIAAFFLVKYKYIKIPLEKFRFWL